MLKTAVILAPLAAVAWYSSQGAKSNVQNEKPDLKNKSWISDNVWVHLENPILQTNAYPGDYMEYDLDQPWGPVQKSMTEEKDPVKAIAMFGQYDAEKNKLVTNLWPEFTKPRREIMQRSVDRPITNVSIMQAGSQPDKLIKLGSRFYDAPVPRWTGTDRYYKRKVTVPFYVVP